MSQNNKFLSNIIIGTLLIALGSQVNAAVDNKNVTVSTVDSQLASDLAKYDWELVSVRNKYNRYLIRFSWFKKPVRLDFYEDADGERYNYYTGCNFFTSSLIFNGNNIESRKTSRTLVTCGSILDSIEKEFFRFMTGESELYIHNDGTRLIQISEDGSVLEWKAKKKYK